MSVKKDDGGSAFPSYVFTEDSRTGADNPGMTLRDYFAAKALQGMLSVVEVQAQVGKGVTMENVANASYEWADAMLKARGGK
jgi:hypothetical protein